MAFLWLGAFKKVGFWVKSRVKSAKFIDIYGEISPLQLPLTVKSLGFRARLELGTQAEAHFEKALSCEGLEYEEVKQALGFVSISQLLEPEMWR